MPTEFKIFFRTKTAKYRYILHIKKENVIYESLDRVKMETERRSVLFVREGNKINLKGIFGNFSISEDLSGNLALLSYLGITYIFYVLITLRIVTISSTMVLQFQEGAKYIWS